MIYSENDLYKAYMLFKEGFNFYDVTNYFRRNNVTLYDKQKIELIIDKIVELRTRRQFIVNNLISDIGEMEEYERKKTNN